MKRIQLGMTAILATAALWVAPAAFAEDDRSPSTLAWSDIQARGQLLYQHDRAYAAAQRRALASSTFANDPRLVTAVTERTGGAAIRVTFVDATPAALYRVEIDLDRYRPGPLEVFTTPAPLTAYEKQALAARALALDIHVETCGREARTIMLPDARTSGQWQVFLLPQAGDDEPIPVGGSHRIDTDGRAVLARHAFADTCVSLDRSAESIGVMVAANPGDPAPNEAHVFWSLWADLPMYVGTDTGLWSINNGAIEPPTALNALRQPGFEGYGQLGIVHAGLGHASLP